MIRMILKRWRNKKYLKWVKTLPCYICLGQGGEAHHIKGVGHLSGVGLTAPDQYTIPTCRECHNRWHLDSSIWLDQWEAIARTLAKAIDEEILIVNKGK